MSAEDYVSKKIHELLRGGWTVSQIASVLNRSVDEVLRYAGLPSYAIPPDFVIPDHAPRKTLADLPDEYWDVGRIEEYNEVPVDERQYGVIPVYHNLAQADPFHCPHCQKVTMFSYNDTHIKSLYLMRCGKCGYTFEHDCRR